MLYIMRHGRTEWNALHKLQGITDIPLNDDGREMARKAGEEGRNIHFDICYCSPLVRAVETASLFLDGRNVPIVCDERLKEMCFGIYEGIKDSMSIPDCPVNVLLTHPENYKAVENGESLEELYARTGEFLKELVFPALKDGKDILIVAHGAVNSCITCQIKDIPIEKFWSSGIENCKLKKLI